MGFVRARRRLHGLLPTTLTETSSTGRHRSLVRATLLLSLATGVSRIAGLAREVLAASYFGVSGRMSAFTIAFQFPNLIRALFADAALNSAFVPVFTDLMQKGKREEAFRLASALMFVLGAGVGLLTAALMLASPALVPLLAPGFANDRELTALTVDLMQLMFPTVPLLTMAALTVGVLHAFDHFTAPAIAPIAWNLIVIAVLAFAVPTAPEDQQIRLYALAVLAATVVQLLLPLPWLRNRGGRVGFSMQWRHPAVRRVLLLLVPVTLALGTINVSLVIDSLIGTLVSEEAPAAIDKAFRIYLLPQGLVPIALSTTLFPTLSRLATRNEMPAFREILTRGLTWIIVLLLPCAVLLAVLAEPVTRLVYERGTFDDEATELVAQALAWWTLSLPAQGLTVLLARAFFSLQQPWTVLWLALGYVAINALVSTALYQPLGVGGVVLGTVLATVAMAAGQLSLLSRRVGGLGYSRMGSSTLRVTVACVPLAVVAMASWRGADSLLGSSLPGQATSLGIACLAAATAFLVAGRLLGAPELATLRRRRFQD